MKLADFVVPEAIIPDLRAGTKEEAARELGWRARTALRDGLAKTIDWYRANRATARNVSPASPSRSSSRSAALSSAS